MELYVGTFTNMQKRFHQHTGQRINELENGPSSYRLKLEYFGSNRVGFDVVWDFAYKNLDHGWSGRWLLHENPFEINAFLSIWTRTIFEFIYALACIRNNVMNNNYVMFFQ